MELTQPGLSPGALFRPSKARESSVVVFDRCAENEHRSPMASSSCNVIRKRPCKTAPILVMRIKDPLNHRNFFLVMAPQLREE